MIIRINWVNKKGEPREICFATGKDKGACESKTVAPPILRGDNVQISLKSRRLESNEISLLVDKNKIYAAISEQATELDFGSNSKASRDIIKLKDIQFENSDTKESLSAASLMYLLTGINNNETSNCGCSK